MSKVSKVELVSIGASLSIEELRLETSETAFALFDLAQERVREIAENAAKRLPVPRARRTRGDAAGEGDDATQES